MQIRNEMLENVIAFSYKKKRTKKKQYSNEINFNAIRTNVRHISIITFIRYFQSNFEGAKVLCFFFTVKIVEA